MRSEVLRVRQSAYVEAARAGGVGWSRRAAAATCCPTRPVRCSCWRRWSSAPRSSPSSSLSFLGYGAPPPTPEWGSLVADGRDYLRTRVVADHDARPDRRGHRAGRQPHRPRPRPAVRLVTASIRVDGRRAPLARRAVVDPRTGRRVPAAAAARSRRSAASTSSCAPARRVALVGESGSGKSTTAHAVVGLLRAVGADHRPGRSASTAPTSSGSASAGRRALRGVDIGLIPQDPTVSLNPVQAHRRPGRRGAPDPRAGRPARRPRRGASRRSVAAGLDAARGPTSTRTSCPAACASGC